MMPTRTVRLSEVITEAKPGFACGEEDLNGIFQIRMNNVLRDGGLDFSKQRRVPNDSKAAHGALLRPGDVLFNATNSPDLIGKTALIKELDEPTVYSNHFLRLRVDQRELDAGYLARYLSWEFGRGTFKGMARQWVNQATVGRDSLLRMSILLPPLEKQRRIAAVFNDADRLRAKRRQAIALLDDLAQSVFLDMFTDYSIFEASCRLADVTDIVSGITKGRRAPNGVSLKSLPYLAVANVQDKQLDLSIVKTIEASESEIEHYRLRRNDLLLTEGGDPDKLGRGTLWNGELPEAIHQNHIFRVRLKDSIRINPVYLNWYVSSDYGKRYFLRAAKQTTGIASINATQLKNFPLQIPPVRLQEAFAARIADIREAKAVQTTSLLALDEIFNALQARAFRRGL
jgi:type I restriction enzyme S subunit